MATGNLITFDTADKLQKVVSGFSNEEIALVKSTVAKGTTNTELGMFLKIAQKTKLDPFMKEIWCYKDTRHNLIIFAGRDGYLKNAQKQSDYLGLRSSDVCENDTFEIDTFNAKVTHSFGKKARGKILGAYAVVLKKDGNNVVEFADFKQYFRGGYKNKNAWDTHPTAMIRKIAEANALKKAYSLSNIQLEHEFVIENGVAAPINSDADFEVIEELTDKQKQILDEITLEIEEFQNADELYEKSGNIIDSLKNKLPENTIKEIENQIQQKFLKLKAELEKNNEPS